MLSTEVVCASFLFLQLVHLGDLLLTEELTVFLVVCFFERCYLFLILLPHFRRSTRRFTLLQVLSICLWALSLWWTLSSWRHATSSSSWHQLSHVLLFTFIDGEELLGGLVIQAKLFCYVLGLCFNHLFTRGAIATSVGILCKRCRAHSRHCEGKCKSL